MRMRHDELEFYWGVSSGGSRRALQEAAKDGVIEHREGRAVNRDSYPVPEFAMVSYATKQNTPWEGPGWMVDCGGYSVLAGHGEYETPCREYVEYVREHNEKIRWWALRDWPCAPSLLADVGRSVRDHQNLTVRDHVKCLELADQLGVDARPMAVLQGHDVRDYLWHLDYLRDNGLLTDRVGIGSVVRGRGEISEVRSIIQQVRDALPARCSLHGFGVKHELLQDPSLARSLDSVDSGAWCSKVSQVAMAHGSKGEHRFTWDRVLNAYGEYRNKLQVVLDVAAAAKTEVRVMRLGEWCIESDVPEGVYPLLECRCGSLLDPNVSEPEPIGGLCRQCQNTALNISIWYTSSQDTPEELDRIHPQVESETEAEAGGRRRRRPTYEPA